MWDLPLCSVCCPIFLPHIPSPAAEVRVVQCWLISPQAWPVAEQALLSPWDELCCYLSP